MADHSVVMEFLKNNAEQLLQAFTLGITGMTIGVARLMTTDDVMTRKKFLGNIILSGGLGMGAAGVLAFVPGLPFVAQMGLSAIFSQMGLMGIEMMLQKITGSRLPEIERHDPGEGK